MMGTRFTSTRGHIVLSPPSLPPPPPSSPPPPPLVSQRPCAPQATPLSQPVPSATHWATHWPASQNRLAPQSLSVPHDAPQFAATPASAHDPWTLPPLEPLPPM